MTTILLSDIFCKGVEFASQDKNLFAIIPSSKST